VSVFYKKYPPGSVLRCPTAAENGSYDQRGFDLPSSLAYNVEPVTNTLCEQRTTDAAVSAQRLTSFVVALFFTLRDSYG